MLAMKAPGVSMADLMAEIKAKHKIIAESNKSKFKQNFSDLGDSEAQQRPMEINMKTFPGTRRRPPPPRPERTYSRVEKTNGESFSPPPTAPSRSGEVPNSPVNVEQPLKTYREALLGEEGTLERIQVDTTEIDFSLLENLIRSEGERRLWFYVNTSHIYNEIESTEDKSRKVGSGDSELKTKNVSEFVNKQENRKKEKNIIDSGDDTKSGDIKIKLTKSIEETTKTEAVPASPIRRSASLDSNSRRSPKSGTKTPTHIDKEREKYIELERRYELVQAQLEMFKKRESRMSLSVPEGEEALKFKEYWEKAAAENEVLKKKLEVMKAQTGSECLDKYDWDGTLEGAEKIFLELCGKIQEDPEDMVLLGDLEKFDEIIKKHPDFAKREEAKAQKWLDDNKDKNLQALEMMHGLLPKETLQLSKSQLSNVFKYRPQLVRRIVNNKNSFMLMHMSKDEVSRLHIVDLANKYDPKNFDIIELRAFFACLPDEFKADPDKAKANWKEKLRKKIEDMALKEKNGTLPKNKQRDPAYSVQRSAPKTAAVKGNGPGMRMRRHPLTDQTKGMLNELKLGPRKNLFSELENTGSLSSAGKKVPSGLLAGIKGASLVDKGKGSGFPADALKAGIKDVKLKKVGDNGLRLADALKAGIKDVKLKKVGDNGPRLADALKDGIKDVKLRKVGDNGPRLADALKAGMKDVQLRKVGDNGPRLADALKAGINDVKLRKVGSPAADALKAGIKDVKLTKPNLSTTVDTDASLEGNFHAGKPESTAFDSPHKKSPVEVLSPQKSLMAEIQAKALANVNEKLEKKPSVYGASPKPSFLDELKRREKSVDLTNTNVVEKTSAKVQNKKPKQSLLEASFQGM